MRRTSAGRAGARHLVFAVAGAALVCALGTLGLRAVGNVDARQPFPAYPTRAQLLDFSYISDEYGRRVAADASSGTVTGLVLGSSELYPPAGMPEHPVELLAPGRYGVDVMALGRPNCECLWQAIEAGACSSRDVPRRIVLIPSLIWFSVARRPAEEWPATFSQGAYDAFMANPRVSSRLKDRVTARLADYGVSARIAGPSLAGAAAGVDGAATEAVQAARRLFARPGSGLPVPGPSGERERPEGRREPNWGALQEAAVSADAAACAGNPWGVFDSWARDGLPGFWSRAAEWDERRGESLSSQELDDFEMALEVCRESGIETMVLLQPVNGRLYDRTRYGFDERQRYYQMLRDACERAGAKVADFSSHEYDEFFLRDDNHPSHVGSLYYSRALYEFFARGEVSTSPI